MSLNHAQDTSPPKESSGWEKIEDTIVFLSSAYHEMTMRGRGAGDEDDIEELFKVHELIHTCMCIGGLKGLL